MMQRDKLLTQARSEMGLTYILADDIICSGRFVKGHLQHAHQY